MTIPPELANNSTETFNTSQLIKWLKVGEGNTAVILQQPGTKEVLKAFPKAKIGKKFGTSPGERPSFLENDDRLNQLLAVLSNNNIPLRPNSRVVEITGKSFFPRGIMMNQVLERPKLIRDEVNASDPTTCIQTSEIIGQLHAHGVTIDPAEKGSYSSHKLQQLFAVFLRVGDEIQVLDWTNLALVHWIHEDQKLFYESIPYAPQPESLEQIWVREIKEDISGMSKFFQLFRGNRFQYLDTSYRQSFAETCSDPAVRDQHLSWLDRQAAHSALFPLD